MKRAPLLAEDTVALEKPDGRRLPGVKANVQPKEIIIVAPALPVEEGDIIRRRLPSGIEELFEVLDLIIYNKSGMEPHFRVKVRRVTAKPTLTQDSTMARKAISVFISHSHQDAELVKRLIALLRSALNLPSSQIRATSVDGFRLPGGSHTTEQLRVEVQSAKVLVGLISQASLKSAYVTFELGARWGSGKPMVPLLAPDVSPNSLAGPLQGINALSCRSSAQLHQFVEEMAEHLSMTLDRPAAYQRCVDDIIEYNSELGSVNQNSTPAEGSASQDLPLRLSEAAKELLLAAALDENGFVMRFRTASGLHVKVHQRDFVADRNARTEARWYGALDELISSGLVRDRDGKGEVFWLTDLGYSEAESIGSEAPKTGPQADD